MAAPDRIEKFAKKLKSPWEIQRFVSAIPYNPDDFCKSAERVLIERTAHCMEGALLASLLLECLGHEPSLLHFRAHRDDDHVVSLFREKGLWGAVGKSNTTLLAWRPPLYRTVRDLLMSYFPFYFNLKGQMSLVAWAGPIRLSRYEKWNWRAGMYDVGDLSAHFYESERSRIIMSERRVEKLPLADRRLVDACFLGANEKGLYRV
ncbi:MAG: hypothetical protein KGP28_04990 [Bdellovibrionales bacterium]|nr:hypothetical protein [Bdellovibrionales bacterium]